MSSVPTPRLVTCIIMDQDSNVSKTNKQMLSHFLALVQINTEYLAPQDCTDQNLLEMDGVIRDSLLEATEKTLEWFSKSRKQENSAFVKHCCKIRAFTSYERTIDRTLWREFFPVLYFIHGLHLN